MKKTIFLIVVLIFASGCGSIFEKSITTGYTYEKVGAHAYRIKYRGTKWDKETTLERNWHRRAGELCPQGYTSGKFENGVDRQLRNSFNFPIGVEEFPYVENVAECMTNK